ncbi:sigma-70 family RNA polymerase sigma factor [Hungatella sp.]|uniref:sigma-70 family RNA polymerase sigma factor n=1 Tax=Hungatella sp. TaxID=2613924 RepID=UPI002A81DC50|nr:sigma-70 family RNA polymerase sigma factor [Hungatella sp.]
MIHYLIAGENEKATAPDSFSPVLFAQSRKKGIIINYYIKIEQQNIPVSKEIYKIWQHGERKDRYFREGDIRNGVFSYDALDGEGLNGSELFAEKDGNPVEHQAERDLLINALKQALNTLNKEDKELLAHIYCQEESLRSIAQSTGVPFTTLQYRHKKVIKKLRHFFEQNFLLLD